MEIPLGIKLDSKIATLLGYLMLQRLFPHPQKKWHEEIALTPIKATRAKILPPIGAAFKTICQTSAC